MWKCRSVGVGLLVLLIAGWWTAVGNPPGHPSEAAADAWNRLAAKADDSRADPAAIWQELITFRRQYPGTPEAIKAAEAPAV